eukprot:4612073-Amphidinium_carterae.1
MADQDKTPYLWWMWLLLNQGHSTNSTCAMAQSWATRRREATVRTSTTGFTIAQTTPSLMINLALYTRWNVQSAKAMYNEEVP